MPRQSPSSGPVRWSWILASVVLTAVLLVVFIRIVDPALERPAVLALVATATVMLVGIVIGRISAGETIVEAGIGGVLLFVLVAGYATGVRGLDVPGIVWVAGPFYVALFAMFAAWVGEMLQGTVEDAHDDERLDWPWVFVCALFGFVLEAYVVFIGGALTTLTPWLLIAILLLCIFATGWIVAFLSPGYTAVEPAIASVVMVVLSAIVADLWLVEPLPVSGLVFGAVAGLVAGLLGGWLGEVTQSGRRALELRRLLRGV